MATYWENSCSFGLRYVSWYKYMIVSLVFSHLGFWSGNLFLVAPFPDLCLLVPFFASLSIMSNPCMIPLRIKSRSTSSCNSSSQAVRHKPSCGFDTLSSFLESVSLQSAANDTLGESTGAQTDMLLCNDIHS